MVTIQVTFMQKVIASVPLLKGEKQVMVHCERASMDTSSDYCSRTMVMQTKCPSDCKMMNVVSVTHFIEDEQPLFFTHTALRYPNFITATAHFQPQGLYRPPLFS